MVFERKYTVENGIERISYIPTLRRFETPILFQHGMYHSANCWELWQQLFAEWGWENHAISLPGHGGSPVQRPIRWCTLSYYLQFVNAATAELSQPPILIGHSMGGALTQWYLKYIGDLPAAVLVAPWSSHGDLWDGMKRFWRLDPLGAFLIGVTLSATPMIRTPQRAARMFITENAAVTPENLYKQLGPESWLVILQHLPPFWSPRKDVKTPLLWFAGEKDALIGVEVERRSAAFYSAEFAVVPGAGHNLMMEQSYRETAELIHQWLARTVS